MAHCISDSTLSEIDEEFVEDTSSLGISPYNFEPVVSDESRSDTNDWSSESDPSQDPEDRRSNSTWYSTYTSTYFGYNCQFKVSLWTLHYHAVSKRMSVLQGNSSYSEQTV